MHACVECSVRLLWLVLEIDLLEGEAFEEMPEPEPVLASLPPARRGTPAGVRRGSANEDEVAKAQRILTEDEQVRKRLPRQRGLVLAARSCDGRPATRSDLGGPGRGRGRSGDRGPALTSVRVAPEGGPLELRPWHCS